MEDILVSVNCITYNHEKYIADAIESFLMQKTSFKFEIIINDDASTDGTADIIRDYERRYPDLIKPTYQEENQYSKGISVSQINHKRSKGKYIALCEGDDFWTDPHKLQKQVDYLEKHPECSLVFHAASVVNADKTATGTIAKMPGESRKIQMDEIALKAEPLYMPTASEMYRKSTMDNPPKWFLDASIGDFPLALIIGNSGYFYYMNEIMSVYRIGVSGSWTDRMFNKKNANKSAIAINEECIQLLNHFNSYSNYQYQKEIENACKLRKTRILYLKMSNYFPTWFVKSIKGNTGLKKMLINKTKILMRM